MGLFSWIKKKVTQARNFITKSYRTAAAFVSRKAAEASSFIKSTVATASSFVRGVRDGTVKLTGATIGRAANWVVGRAKVAGSWMASTARTAGSWLASKYRTASTWVANTYQEGKKYYGSIAAIVTGGRNSAPSSTLTQAPASGGQSLAYRDHTPLATSSSSRRLSRNQEQQNRMFAA